MGSISKTDSDNVVRKLGIPLSGFCAGGFCFSRGQIAKLWTSTPGPTNGMYYERSFMNNSNAVARAEYSNAGYTNVRCLKDY